MQSKIPPDYVYIYIKKTNQFLVIQMKKKHIKQGCVLFYCHSTFKKDTIINSNKVLVIWSSNS